VAIGKDLLDTKERLPHGSFLPWIEAEFGMSDMTAKRFMQVAKAYGEKPNIVFDLPPTALYELAAPKTPIEFRRLSPLHRRLQHDVLQVALNRLGDVPTAMRSPADDPSLGRKLLKASGREIEHLGHLLCGGIGDFSGRHGGSPGLGKRNRD
jgi:hypothetical protein